MSSLTVLHNFVTVQSVSIFEITGFIFTVLTASKAIMDIMHTNCFGIVAHTVSLYCTVDLNLIELDSYLYVDSIYQLNITTILLIFANGKSCLFHHQHQHHCINIKKKLNILSSLSLDFTVSIQSTYNMINYSIKLKTGCDRDSW